MKKYFLAMLLVAFAVAANAQVRTSRTFTKQKSRTEYILRAGLSINKLSGLDIDDDYSSYTFDTSSKMGFAVDFDFNKYFGQSNGYWGMGLGIGSRGVSFNIGEYEGGISSYNIKLTALTLGYKYAITDKIKVDPHFNIYLAYDFAVSASGDIDDADYDLGFDAGIQPGIGVWYDRFNFDLSYMLGFVNACPYIDGFNGHYEYGYGDGGKTGNLVLRVGVRF